MISGFRLLLIFAALFKSTAFAAAPIAPGPDGKPVDVGPLVDFLKQYVYTTTRPVFVYSWLDTHFVTCAVGNPLSWDSYSAMGGAFVLTSGRLMTPDHVKIFNRKSRDDKQDRSTIQSMFIQAQLDGQGGNSAPVLWRDLKETKADPNLGKWMRENLFGCTGQTPYVKAQDFDPSHFADTSCPIEIKPDKTQGWARSALNVVEKYFYETK